MKKLLIWVLNYIDSWIMDIFGDLSIAWFAILIVAMMVFIFIFFGYHGQ